MRRRKAAEFDSSSAPEPLRSSNSFILSSSAPQQCLTALPKTTFEDVDELSDFTIETSQNTSAPQPLSPSAHWLRVLGAATVSALISALIYYPALNAEFVFDDHGAILENSDVTGIGDWRSKVDRLIRNDFWGTPMELSAHKSYRPLTTLTFHMNFVETLKP